MRQKLASLLVTLGFAALVAGQGNMPETTPLELLNAIVSLQSVLASDMFPPGVNSSWGDYEFARYTGGRLASMGYDVRLAHAGKAWWVVVVYVSARDEEFYIPVVPGYPSEKVQVFARGMALGHVPLDYKSTQLFMEKYLAWEQLVPLPPNTPPVAEMRVLGLVKKVGIPVRFLGLMSSDPDGRILNFFWDFGDGNTSFTMNTNHIYARPGTYLVRLTVVDDGGLADTATTVIEVIAEDETPPTSSGCGCGG